MSRSRVPVFTASPSSEAPPYKQPGSIPMRIFASCLTSVVVAVHYTNYGPLIPTLISDLHINSGQAGLLSTFLFLGLAVMYVPAGVAVDRYGQRPVLIGSSIIIVVGAVLLPLFSSLPWILLCRFVVGLGSGAAFVAGAGVAANLGKHSSLGQGLYGGSVQIGSGLGLLVTPHLSTLFGWRGSFLIWGLAGILSIIVWLFVNDGQEVHKTNNYHFQAGIRSPAVWTLGLSHMGTFGLGNAIATWLAVYLAFQYGLPLALAASLGSLAILSGMFFRPLGGILIARRVIGAVPLLRLGTILNCAGVAILAIPLRSSPLLFLGLASISIGTTIPYTSVFNEAAYLRNIGKGVAQGLVSMISIPAVILGPPLIGVLFENTHNFTLAFGSMLFFGFVAITASFLAGPAVQHETTLSERP